MIDRVQLVSARLGVAVSVTLRSGERCEVGEAEGAATSGALHRTVAEATLRAVEQDGRGEVRFAVEHVEIASTGQERTALVVLSLVTDRGHPAAFRGLGGPRGRASGDHPRGAGGGEPAGRPDARRGGGLNLREPLPHWPGREVELPSGRLHVRSAPPTARGAERAVLLHGLGGAATNWTDVMELLRDRVASVAPDLPGFGWSPPPADDDYSLRTHARAGRRS